MSASRALFGCGSRYFSAEGGVFSARTPCSAGAQASSGLFVAMRAAHQTSFTSFLAIEPPLRTKFGSELASLFAPGAGRGAKTFEPEQAPLLAAGVA